eukprot:scaffold2.g7105.t1
MDSELLSRSSSSFDASRSSTPGAATSRASSVGPLVSHPMDAAIWLPPPNSQFCSLHASSAAHTWSRRPSPSEPPPPSAAAPGTVLAAGAAESSSLRAVTALPGSAGHGAVPPTGPGPFLQHQHPAEQMQHQRLILELLRSLKPRQEQPLGAPGAADGTTGAMTSCTVSGATHATASSAGAGAAAPAALARAAPGQREQLPQPAPALPFLPGLAAGAHVTQHLPAQLLAGAVDGQVLWQLQQQQLAAQHQLALQQLAALLQGDQRQQLPMHLAAPPGATATAARAAPGVAACVTHQPQLLQRSGRLRVQNASGHSLLGLDDACQSYCTQVITRELNDAALHVLRCVRSAHLAEASTGVHPLTRRCFCSIKEVLKVAHCARVIIVAPDVRYSPTAVVNAVRLLRCILRKAQDAGVPVVFALSRRGIGQVFGPDKNISVVAVMRTEHCEPALEAMLALAAAGRARYAAARGAGCPAQQLAASSSAAPVVRACAHSAMTPFSI